MWHRAEMGAKAEIDAENSCHICLSAYLLRPVLTKYSQAEFSIQLLINPVFTLLNTNI
jgi:hypothetical protein